MEMECFNPNNPFDEEFRSFVAMIHSGEENIAWNL
jgi:hypothetical protein